MTAIFGAPARAHLYATLKHLLQLPGKPGRAADTAHNASFDAQAGGWDVFDCGLRDDGAPRVELQRLDSPRLRHTAVPQRRGRLAARRAPGARGIDPAPARPADGRSGRAARHRSEVRLVPGALARVARRSTQHLRRDHMTVCFSPRTSATADRDAMGGCRIIGRPDQEDFEVDVCNANAVDLLLTLGP